MSADNLNSQMDASGLGLQNVFERFDEQQAKDFIESAKVQALFDLHQIPHPIDKQDLLAIYKARLHDHQEGLLAIY